MILPTFHFASVLVKQEKPERETKVFQMIIVIALFSRISGSLYFILMWWLDFHETNI